MPQSANPRWNKRPEGSTWGDWGPNDQLGRLNLLTPERVRAAVSEVRDGHSFCLSLPLDLPGGLAANPRRPPPMLNPTRRGDFPNMAYPLSRDDPRLTDVICDDTVLLTLQYSTQWDSLAHVGQLFDTDGDGVPEMVFYNGYRAGEHVVGPVDFRGGRADPVDAKPGARSLGIENMAASCVQGRGVMVDLKAHLGTAQQLVGYDALMRILEADKVVVEAGDLVCLRTGLDELILGMAGNPDPQVVTGSCAGLDGRDERLQRWITETGLVALISDNLAVEGLPAAPCLAACCASLPLHAHCLFRLGVYLGELWLLSPLAEWLRARGRSRFLLTAPPLRLPGAVGSPVTPVATV